MKKSRIAIVLIIVAFMMVLITSCFRIPEKQEDPVESMQSLDDVLALLEEPEEEFTQAPKEPEIVQLPYIEPVEVVPEVEHEEALVEELPEWEYDDSLLPEENILIYLTKYLNYSDAAACGIIANIAHETGWKFNPKAGSSSHCYGLIQWMGGRLSNLKKWCNENGKDYKSIQGQLDFMDWEMQNADPYGTYDYLINCEDSEQGAYDSAWYFCYWYERPANKTARSNIRGEEAMDYYRALVLGMELEEV